MSNTFKFGVDLLDNPRYDSKPTQPKDPGEMSRQEEDDLFDATLARDDVVEMVWEVINDEINDEQRKEIVYHLFCTGRGGQAAAEVDFIEAARLIYRPCIKRVQKIVDDASSNTDMGRD